MKVVIKLMLFILLYFFISCKNNERINICSNSNLYQYLFKTNIKPFLDGEICEDCEYYILVQGEDKKYYMVKNKILKFLYFDFIKNKEIDYEIFICELISGNLELNLSDYAKNPAIKIHQLYLNKEFQSKFQSEKIENIVKEFELKKGEFTYSLSFESPFEDDFIYYFFKKGYLYADDHGASSNTFVSIEKLLKFYEVPTNAE